MHFAYGTFTPFGWPFHAILLYIYSPHHSPTTPKCTHFGLGCSAFARHYLRNHYCFLFLLLLRCFSSEGCRLLSTKHHLVGLPHSDICGSKVICTSPQLFAAYHVLRRLREPRHPPYALIRFLFVHHLTTNFSAPWLGLYLYFFISLFPILVNELFIKT